MNMEDLLTCDFTMNEFRPLLYLGIYQILRTAGQKTHSYFSERHPISK